MKNGKRTAALGGSAALALALGGVLVPTMATAEEKQNAPVDGSAYDAAAQALLASDEAIGAVGIDGDNNVVVYTTAEVSELSADAQEFIETHDNIVVNTLTTPLEARDANEVVGGAGYMSANESITDGGYCSIGFSAWTPDGEPAFISAGHCTGDSAFSTAYLTRPSTEPAVGGEGGGFSTPFATLGFSQYGGPGDSTGEAGDLTSHDISAWDITDEALTTLPEVTDWTTAGEDDLAGSTTVVKSVGEAQVGDQIARSGRTSGYETGTVLETKVWASVSGRYVYGFLTDANSIEGDSGGPFVRGTTALGVLSGGADTPDGPISFAADLTTGLELTGGYTIKLRLDAPTVTTSGNVSAGTAVTGTASANSTVVVAIGDEKTETTSDASGNWSVEGPTERGTYTVSAIVRDGYNTSKAGTGEFTVVAEPIAAPVITTPGAKTVDKVTAIGGTGVAGAVVTVSGDVSGEATVAEDGTWTLPVDLSYGTYEVWASQVHDEEASPVSEGYTFEVVPTAPTITSPEAGATFAAGKAPTTVTGTGVTGATISVSVNGSKVAESASLSASAEVVDGTWEVELPELGSGEFVIAATQAIEGATSSAASVAITVEAAATPTPTPTEPTEPTPTPTDPSEPSEPSLPETGTTDATPLALGALVLLIGGVVLVAARRSRATQG